MKMRVEDVGGQKIIVGCNVRFRLSCKWPHLERGIERLMGVGELLNQERVGCERDSRS
jgi:hypothetical protein